MKIKHITEALDLKVAKKYREKWDSNTNKDLFAKAGAKYRIYIPFEKEVRLSDKSRSILNDVNDAINIIRYLKISDNFTKMFKPYIDLEFANEETYREGILKSGKQQFKIGKTLQLFANAIKNGKLSENNDGTLSKNDEMRIRILEAAYQSFMKDNERTKARQLNICISRHPYDIAGMSTDRHWTSCTHLQDGSNRHYVLDHSNNAALIAYVIREDDTNINSPLARVNILPFYNTKDSSDVYFVVHPYTYGTKFNNFQKTVQDYIDKLNDQVGTKDGLYCVGDKFYNDGINRTVVKFKNPVTDPKKQFEIISEHTDLTVETFKETFLDVTDEFLVSVLFVVKSYQNYRLLEYVSDLVLESDSALKILFEKIEEVLSSPELNYMTVNFSFGGDVVMEIDSTSSLFYFFEQKNQFELISKYLPVDTLKNIVKTNLSQASSTTLPTGVGVILNSFVINNFKIYSEKDRIEILKVVNANDKQFVLPTFYGRTNEFSNSSIEYISEIFKLQPNLENFGFISYFETNNEIETFSNLIREISTDNSKFLIFLNSMLSFLTYHDDKFLDKNQTVQKSISEVLVNSDNMLNKFLTNNVHRTSTILRLFFVYFPSTKLILKFLDDSRKHINYTPYSSALASIIRFDPRDMVDTVNGIGLTVHGKLMEALTTKYTDIIFQIIPELRNSEIVKLFLIVLNKNPSEFLKLEISRRNFFDMRLIVNDILEEYTGDTKNLVYLIPAFYSAVLRSTSTNDSSEISEYNLEILELLSSNWDDYVKKFKEKGYIK